MRKEGGEVETRISFSVITTAHPSVQTSPPVQPAYCWTRVEQTPSCQTRIPDSQNECPSPVLSHLSILPTFFFFPNQFSFTADENTGLAFLLYISRGMDGSNRVHKSSISSFNTDAGLLGLGPCFPVEFCFK